MSPLADPLHSRARLERYLDVRGVRLWPKQRLSATAAPPTNIPDASWRETAPMSSFAA